MAILDKDALQWGKALTGDFQENTMTFEMEDGFYLQAGKYAIIRVETMDQEMELEKLTKNY